MTHGMQILTALRAEMQRLARKPSDVESAAVIDGYLAANAVKLKRAKKAGMPKVRARDAVFDCLAHIDGQTGAITRHAGARIAGAKKQILEVMPEATADQVIAEIEKRWARFCRKFTDARNRTAMALVGHWGEFGGADAADRRRTKAEKADIMQEPAGDWRKVMSVLYNVPLDCEGVQRPWAEISPEYRRVIVDDMLKNAP